MSSFQYEPLDTSSSQIRLVQVSSTTGVAIRCAIETFDLDTYPEYEALSYTWGPPPPTRTIFLNGQQFHVRENLWCFLDHVARNSIASLAGVEFEPRYLWIDQLSIDQSSTAEKSHQVRQMAQIFKQARRVVAWLGEEEAGSDAAMQLIGRAVGVCQEYFRGDSEEYEVRPEILSNNTAFFQQLYSNIEPLKRLFRRRYWTRLWIVQELILAQDLIIACGNCAVPFVGVRMVDASLYLLDQRSFDVDAHGLLDLFPDQVRFLVIWTQDSPRQRRSPEMVPEVFMVYSGMECENPKDKVYALSAIVEGRLDITVDYSRPASWVYWDVMNVMKGLNMGAHCHRYWVIQLGLTMGVTGNEPNAPSPGISSGDAGCGWLALFDNLPPTEVFANAHLYSKRTY